MDLNDEINEYLEIRQQIESQVFQKFIVEPLRKYQEGLKNAYDCQTLIELATVKGKKAGVDEFFKTLKRIDVEFKNKKNEIDGSYQGR
jgi:hypothetical protein